MNEKQLLAKPLEKGDTVAILAPSSRCTDAFDDVAGECIKYVEAQGYHARVYKSLTSKYRCYAGDDETRANDINSAFADSEIDAIFCARGGCGAMRLLNRLDYDVIERNPKIFCGFSDVTALHSAIYQKTGLVTFHTPMLTTCMIRGFDGDAKSAFEKLLISGEPYGAFKNPNGADLCGYNPARAEGSFIGGNLSLLTALCGTEYNFDPTGKIIFIEDVDEAMYRIDRMLTTLKLGRVFEKCAGIVFGALTNCETEKHGGLEFSDVLNDIVLPSGKPVLTGLSAGHITKNISLPMGARAIIDSEKKELVFIGKHLN